MNELFVIMDNMRKRIEKNSFLYWDWKGNKSELIITEIEAIQIINQVIAEADMKFNMEKYETSNFGRILLSRHLPGWIPINPDDESTFPKDDSFILLSFTNYPICSVGQYKTDKEGGAFYLASNFKSCLEHGFIVNAWQPLPEPYKDEQCSK